MQREIVGPICIYKRTKEDKHERTLFHFTTYRASENGQHKDGQLNDDKSSEVSTVKPCIEKCHHPVESRVYAGPVKIVGVQRWLSYADE